MYILCVADTHNRLYESDMSALYEYIKQRQIQLSAVVSLGDVADFEYKILFHDFLRPLPRYGVLGNHDWSTVLGMNHIEDIHSRVLRLPNGMTAAGFSGSARYKPGNQPMWTQKESLEISKLIGPADILFSHDTLCDRPDALYDELSAPQDGLLGITEYLHHNPQCWLHIHGHLHTPYIKHDNGVTRICVHKLAVVNISDEHTATVVFSDSLRTS